MQNEIKGILPVGVKNILKQGIRITRSLSTKRANHRFINSFNYRSDDVVIVSYPKAGSTWLRFIMGYLINDTMPDYEQDVDFLRVQQIVPALSNDALNKARADFVTLPSPRIMRSHSLYTPKFPKVVYLMRDGRDIAVSYYYHFKKLRNYQGSFYDFLASNIRNVEWDQHANSWIYHNESLNCMYIVKYEDMLQNPFTEIKQLVRFAGLDKTDDQIYDAIKKSSFDNMRKIEKEKGLGYVDGGNSDLFFVRKGQSAGWIDEFGEKEKALFKEKFGDCLIKAGYESSFEW